MPISDGLKAQILRYYFAEHWRVGTIARQLGVHHSSVERVLREAGVERERRRPRRPALVDPFIPFITEVLEQFPTLTAARLFDIQGTWLSRRARQLPPPVSPRLGDRVA